MGLSRVNRKSLEAAAQAADGFEAWYQQWFDKANMDEKQLLAKAHGALRAAYLVGAVGGTDMSDIKTERDKEANREHV